MPPRAIAPRLYRRAFGETSDPRAGVEFAPALTRAVARHVARAFRRARAAACGICLARRASRRGIVLPHAVRSAGNTYAIASGPQATSSPARVAARGE
jgi:hypothetical protein